MNLVMYVFCLIVWLAWFAQGIFCCVKHKEVDKVIFILATLVCIVHYLERIIYSL